MNLSRLTAFAAVVVALSACAPKGPAYQRPALPMPAAFDVPEPFRASQPADALPKGAWWTIYGDSDLNELQGRAMGANQSIQVAAAQYAQARALTAEALSAIYPHISIDGQVSGQRASGTRAGASQAATSANISVPLSVGYEVDLFGRRQRSIESAEATLQASAAAVENVRLIIASEVAADYITLRRLDTELDLLARAVDVVERALTLVRNRFAGGVASGLDVAQEEALLASTRTQATLVRQQRQRFEHALAVLVGQPAAGFRVPARVLTLEVPAVATGIPSELLERRPDIAEAERRVAAANARLGIARSAFFPSVTLFGSAGLQSGSLLKLFDVPSMIWAVGAAVAQDLFTGGARQARVDYASAGVDAAAADYRGTVLQALADVQDALSGLDVLTEARRTQTQAVEASERALTIANNRYAGGLASALDLVSAQQAVIANQRLAAQLDGERLVTTVALVKALGGGWDAASLAAVPTRPLTSRLR